MEATQSLPCTSPSLHIDPQSMRKTPPPAPAAETAEGGSGKRSPAKAPADPAAMLRKEIDIMRSLRHPNIVALHEVSFRSENHGPAERGAASFNDTV